jgi:hypothetical protein
LAASFSPIARIAAAGGPIEDEAGGLDRLGEIGVLGEKAVAGMDRLRAGLARRVEDAVGAQIALGGGGGADAHRLVGHGDMLRRRVGVGIDRHGPHPEPSRGGDDAAGDFAAIGDQELAEHRPSAPPG